MWLHFNDSSDFAIYFSDLTFQVMFPNSEEVKELSGEFQSEDSDF